jgi:hypothetical protein
MSQELYFGIALSLVWLEYQRETMVGSHHRDYTLRRCHWTRTGVAGRDVACYVSTVQTKHQNGGREGHQDGNGHENSARRASHYQPTAIQSQELLRIFRFPGRGRRTVYKPGRAACEAEPVTRNCVRKINNYLII